MKPRELILTIALIFCFWGTMVLLFPQEQLKLILSIVGAWQIGSWSATFANLLLRDEESN